MAIDRKAEILDAFMRLVSQFGVDKTTMQDVAKEAEISVGVIYKDFKNKEDLIDAFTVRVCQEFNFSCKSFLDRDLPAEQLMHDFMIGFFENICLQMNKNRGFHQLMEGVDFFKYIRKHISKKELFRQELEKTMEQIMEKGVNEGVFEIDDLGKTAALFLKAFNGFMPEITVGQKSFAEILPDIEAMFCFLIKAIKKKA